MDAKVKAQFDAHCAGKAWAMGLKVGDVYIGASPLAKLRYGGDDSCRRMFMWAALDVLETKRLCTDDMGVITVYE